MDSRKFAEQNLEALLNSKELKPYFCDKEGKKRMDGQTQQMYEDLKRRVESSYQEHAHKYFEHRGFMSKYVAPIFRGIGAGLDFLGDLFYLPTAGASLAVTKLPAFFAKGIADTFDGLHYLTHGDYKSIKDLGHIIGESAVERAVAYLPIYGLGSGLDLLRGRRKFDNRVKDYALKKAKEDFLKGINKEFTIQPYPSGSEIIGTNYFANHRYVPGSLEDPSARNDAKQLGGDTGKIVPLSYFQRRGYEAAA